MEALGGAAGPQEQALQAFCRQTLAECMGQEKAAMLQPYLFFHTLVQLYTDSLKPGRSPSALKGEGGHGCLYRSKVSMQMLHLPHAIPEVFTVSPAGSMTTRVSTGPLEVMRVFKKV